jgi:phage-related protein (TIGR01555 family)
MGRIRDALRVLFGGSIDTTPPEPPKVPGTEMRVSLTALAEASAISGRELVNPWQLPRAPDFVPKGAIAMDRAPGGGIGDIYAWAMGGAWSEGLGFLGYPYLAELSQRPEYRRVSEIFAAETTRKWLKFNGNKERIDLIEAAMKRHDIRARFRRAAELDGFFGRSQIFVDLGDRPNSTELQKPMVAAAKVAKGKIKNFKVVEPFWSYPGRYESTNPLDPDFYTPQLWYVMASQVHASRLLTIVGREMPDMLKPAYSFGGLSLSQMIKPYVDNWLRTRQSVSDLLHSFSTMVLATDMGTILQGGPAGSLLTRLQLFNQTRDNRGVMAINKDSEELTNVSTPLGTLDKLLAQSQEQIASVSGIPLVILLGVTPSGLNASSDGEVRTFYATVKSYQEKTFRSPLTTILELIQLDLDGKIDPEITFDFVDLWEMDEKDKALVRKSDADMDVAYVGAGIVSNEEVRARVVQDENSPYFGMDLSEDAPDLDTDEGELDEGGEFDDEPPVDVETAQAGSAGNKPEKA